MNSSNGCILRFRIAIKKNRTWKMQFFNRSKNQKRGHQPLTIDGWHACFTTIWFDRKSQHTAKSITDRNKFTFTAIRNQKFNQNYDSFTGHFRVAFSFIRRISLSLIGQSVNFDIWHVVIIKKIMWFCTWFFFWVVFVSLCL